MKSKWIVCGFFIAFLLAACSNNNDTSGNGSKMDVIMPLAIGNSWTYEVQPADSADGVPMFTDSVIGFDTINGVQWALVQRSSLASSFFYRDASDGLHKVETYDTAGIFDNLLAKYPAQTGDSYTDSLWIFYHNGGDTNWKVMPGSATTTVLSINESVSVPAGTFHALKYEYLPSLSYPEQYYVPGIGMVEMDNLQGTVKYVLVHYSLH